MATPNRERPILRCRNTLPGGRICDAPYRKGTSCRACDDGRAVLETFAEAGAISRMMPVTDYRRRRHAAASADLEEFGPSWRDPRARVDGKGTPWVDYLRGHRPRPRLDAAELGAFMEEHGPEVPRRERQVYDLYVLGRLTRTECAARMGIAPTTFDVHLKNLRRRERATRVEATPPQVTDDET